MDEFTITINSDASKQLYPNNTPASFRIRLNPALEFPISEEWEVGLCELTYPQYWETIKEDSTFLIIRELIIDTEDGIRFKHDNRYKCVFPRGIYRSIDKVVESIYQNIWWSGKSYPISQPVKYSREALFVEGRARREFSDITFDPLTKLVTLGPANIASGIKITGQLVIISGLDLWKTLGFENLKINTVYYLPLTGTSPARVGISDFPAIFVHAKNLIEYQIVGDRMDTLLEIVPIETQTKGASWTFRQQKPLYKKVMNGYISHLEFDIHDHLGVPIPFQFGKVSLVLNFRKCRFKRNLEKEF